MAGAEHSLASLVGPREELVGTARVDPGTVMLVLKNGKPVRVVGTGRGYKRGWGLPVVGQLTGIPISTATHVASVEVVEVSTKCEFHLPKVSVTFELRLQPQDDWEALLDYVDREGDNFAERLLPRVQKDMEKLVRSSIGRHRHEDLYKRDLSKFLPTKGELLDGLFEIMGFRAAKPEWNPNFVSIMVGKEETLAGVARAGQKGMVELAEFAAAKEVASARALASGRSIHSFLNPDMA